MSFARSSRLENTQIQEAAMVESKVLVVSAGHLGLGKPRLQESLEGGLRGTSKPLIVQGLKESSKLKRPLASPFPTPRNLSIPNPETLKT